MSDFRGSTWGKWDLHIHTPKSIYNNYGGDNEEVWEKYIQSLENLPKEVEVIGINDYYFIDGFEKVMEYKMKRNRLANIKKIFPILEFRIDKFGTANGNDFQKINLHILFCIDESIWKQEIKKIRDEFISRINLTDLPEHKTVVLSKDNLSKYGGNLATGFAELIPSTKQVFDLIENSYWQDRTFTFLGYKEWNNLEKGGQLKKIKDNLYKRVGAFFTNNEKDIEDKNTVLNIFGDKVVLHSLDIHKFEEFDNYKCFTWIKADKTFEGLKQILIEPKERLKIQENNPFYNENKTNVIDSIVISNSNNWFENRTIQLNSGLVSIIGEKGAGKTALLDLIAVSNEEGIYEKDNRNVYSFYNRAKDSIKNTKVEIEFLGGSKEIFEVDGQPAKPKSDKYAKVRYLSLKELESYCDEKYKFQEFIKDIILSAYPEVANFDENSKRIVDNIKRINIDINRLYEQTKGLNDLNKAITNKKIELDNHLKNEPKISTNFTPEQDQQYKQLISKEQVLKTNINNKQNEQNEINDLANWMKVEINAYLKDFANKLQTKANSFSYLDKSMINTMNLHISVPNFEQFQNRFKELEVEKNNLKKDLENLKKYINPLELLNKNLVNEQNITKLWYENKNNIENGLISLENSKKKIEETLKQIQSLRRQIKEEYINLFNIKISQKYKYEELKTQLEADKNIEFKVKIEFNEDKFFGMEDSIVKHNQGNSQDKIKEILLDKFIKVVELIDKKIQSEDFSEIISIIDWVNSTVFIREVFGIDKDAEFLLKKGFTPADFYNWIFDDYYEVNYFINFKGRALEALSPGQKGLALMKIFLKLDKSTKPLLIDQPEDNLDNKSVYFDLVSDFKDIKKKRQIIIATHNPNLVVNSDSEQVIIAKFEDSPLEGKPKITYSAGPLEDKNIRKEVCGILEGGDTAFIKREHRYELKDK
jgi:Chromosome segregation ATPases